MKAPDKIYVKEFDEGISQMWSRVKATETTANVQHEYIRKDALIEWIKSEMERLWELLPDADNPNPTQTELRYLGQYMQMEALEDKLNLM